MILRELVSNLVEKEQTLYSKMRMQKLLKEVLLDVLEIQVKSTAPKSGTVALEITIGRAIDKTRLCVMP